MTVGVAGRRMRDGMGPSRESGAAHARRARQRTAVGVSLPILLSVVADQKDAYAYRVAANAGETRFGSTGSALASMTRDGHTVRLASPDAALGSLGTADAQNELTYAAATPGAPSVFVRPVD